MRWKLIMIASFLGALLASVEWCLLAIVGFGLLGIVFAFWIAVLGLIIPILMSTLATIFVYRHTAQRRKMQGFLTFVLTLILSLGSYLAIMRFFKLQLSISW